MNTLWKWLDGKKRNIALVYWCITVPLMPTWFGGKTTLDEVANKVSVTLGIILSAIGMTSAVAKDYANKKIQEINKEGV
jgi:hypothetical protein